MKNKIILLVGMSNERSLSFGIAKELSKAGATIIITAENEKMVEKVKEATAPLHISDIFQLNINSEQELKTLFHKIKEKYQKLDGVVHAIAGAAPSAIGKPLTEITKDEFLQTAMSSAYSLISISKEASPLMNDGGSIITLSYIGSSRVMQGYGIMGPIKAMLEAEVRYLADELGSKKIRVNTISAGPVKTLASSMIPGIRDAIKQVEESSPLKESITNSEVGKLAIFLLSDNSRLITGETIYLDSGMHLK